MDLYNVDRLVDGLKCYADHDIIHDLWAVDKFVDKKDTDSSNIFVDPMTEHIILQQEAQSQIASFCHKTKDVAELLKTDMEVDKHNQRNEMQYLSSMLKIDSEIEEVSMLKKFKMGTMELQTMYSVDVAIDERFITLLETDQEVDGAEKDTTIVDHITPTKHNDGDDLIGQLFDVADLIATDIQVDKCSLGQANSMASALEQNNDGHTEEFIGHLFGLRGEDLVSAKEDNVDKQHLSPSGDKLIGHIFGINNVPGFLDSSRISDKCEEKSKEEDKMEESGSDEKKKRKARFISYMKKKGRGLNFLQRKL